MTTRKLTIVIGVFIFICAIILFNVLASGPSEDEVPQSTTVAAIGVPILEAIPSTITSEIYFTGRVIPKYKLDLFAEVTGTLNKGSKSFKTGTLFKEGDVLAHIDDREQKQSMLNQKSQFQSLLTQILADINIDYPDEYKAWNTYLTDMDIYENLEALPVSENRSFNLFLTGRGVNSSYFAIKQSEVRLSKYTIIAPFDGALTQSTIDPGTLVRASQKIGEFTGTEVYEIEASINASDRFFIKIGDQVSVTLEAIVDQEMTATVARINSQIDAATQTVLIYLEVSRGEILSGQYITGNILGESFDDVVKISSKSLVRDNVVFLANNSVASLKTIDILAVIRDSVIVQGLDTGDLVIDEFRDAAFEGTSVVPINN